MFVDGSRHRTAEGIIHEEILWAKRVPQTELYVFGTTVIKVPVGLNKYHVMHFVWKGNVKSSNFNFFRLFYIVFEALNDDAKQFHKVSYIFNVINNSELLTFLFKIY